MMTDEQRIAVAKDQIAALWLGHLLDLYLKADAENARLRDRAQFFAAQMVIANKRKCAVEARAAVLLPLSVTRTTCGACYTLAWCYFHAEGWRCETCRPRSTWQTPDAGASDGR